MEPRDYYAFTRRFRENESEREGITTFLGEFFEWKKTRGLEMTPWFRDPKSSAPHYGVSLDTVSRASPEELVDIIANDPSEIVLSHSNESVSRLMTRYSEVTSDGKQFGWELWRSQEHPFRCVITSDRTTTPAIKGCLSMRRLIDKKKRCVLRETARALLSDWQQVQLIDRWEIAVEQHHPS